MFAVLASLGFANAATVTDVLTAKLFTATGNSYTDFSNVTVTSSAVYAGNSAKSDAGAIQLRSKKNNSGIVTTASAGTVRKITVVWDDATASGRTIDVYGKSTAYSSDTDLFGSADVQGVLIGSIAKGKSELVVEGDYQFIGIRSNFGAIYVTSISVEWETGSTPAKLKAPVISGVENGVEYKSAKVAISYPAGATSMTWAVTKDGAAWKGGDATSAVSVDVTEDGSYEVSASATDGATTKTAENVTFTIKAPAAPTVGYEAMDVANVKEGNYIIVGENDGKFYMMKNETYSVNYVAATETTLNGTESFSSANLFTIKEQGEGYTIQSADGKYVTVEKSTNGTKTYYNLRVGKDASDAVWKFADATGGKVQATYGEFTNFMSFIWYAKVEPGVPEFSTGYQDSHIRPAFYYVGDVTPVEPEAVKVASIAEFYTKGLADSGPEYEFTCPLTATYQSGKNLYVTDGTDGMLIYGQPDKVCVNGFVLAPGVKGKFSNFNGSYQLTNAVLTEITDNGKGVAPEEMEHAVHELIKRAIKKHKRVIFNGNGYTDEWIAEAEARGLYNLKSTPDALPMWIADKNVELFTSHKIFTKEEIHSRYEIWLENYSKTINIESNTMAEMVQKDLLPSVLTYMEQIASTASMKTSVVPGISTESEAALLTKLTDLAGKMTAGLETLKADTAKALATEDVLECAKAYQSVVLADMETLRAACDEAETLIPDALLPYPTYGKLLFSI